MSTTVLLLNVCMDFFYQLTFLRDYMVITILTEREGPVYIQHTKNNSFSFDLKFL